MQLLTRVFARKTAAASNFERLSLWWGLFWWHFCLEAEQNCECWCSSKSEKAWSWLRWCLETLKYRKSITSINHIYGQFGSNTYCPYFHHGLYIRLPQKHCLCESSLPPWRQIFPWFWNIIIQNLSCVDFHDMSEGSESNLTRGDITRGQCHIQGPSATEPGSQSGPHWKMTEQSEYALKLV